MKKILPLIMAILAAVSANAVTITCVNEGNNIARIDYDATGELSLPKAFALDITVNNSATIKSISNYKVGDSTTASPGFGIFPRAVNIDQTGQIIDYGSPDVKSGSVGALGGIGTSGVTLEMASRYSGSQNSPLVKGTLCKIQVNTGGAQTVNVRVAANSRAGGVILENAAVAQFTGVGCTLSTSAPPPYPTPPLAPLSISYPTSSNTGQYSVEWSASEGTISYRLERSGNSGSTWSVAYTGSGTSFAENIGNGSYRYRVNAQNSIGSSGWMAGSWNCVVSITTPPPSGNIYEAESATLNGAVISTAVGGYTGTSFVDYIHASGDYIQWTVNAASAGSYELKIRYALASGSRPLSIMVNGSIVNSSLSFSVTGSWSNWSTVSLTVNLNAGTNNVRATAIGYSGPNIDNLEVTAAVTPPPPPTSKIYEAENATLSGAVVSKAVSGYTGTGFVDYINASGDYIQWTVNADSAGSYDLKIRYALASGSRSLSVRVNGNTVIQSLSFPATGSWTKWSTVIATVNLKASTNTIRLTAIGSSGPNIDNLQIVPSVDD